jgi:UDP-N-acetylmuramoyl-L-alanyl-D-glutamate--2,6-diaminopimelate ligase
MDRLFSILRSMIPRKLFRLLQPAYHFLWALGSALWYRFPSRKIRVIGVTGTKGKTSTAEMIDAILEAAGEKTAVLGTVRFKIGDNSVRNLYKMTMPGRAFVQRFLADAVRSGCTTAIIEMTSEGAKQYRQRFIEMDALVFTNLSPEHIESHGSYEAYRDAKLSIARTLARSTKPRRLMVANSDDAEGGTFLAIPGVQPVPFSFFDARHAVITDRGSTFHFEGVSMATPLPGKFSLMNAIAAATLARKFGISIEAIRDGLANLKSIPGRAEEIDAGQGFRVVVDYAHTKESLESLYEAYANDTLVCVLGNTGGGRDKWKRPVMARTAEQHCAYVILTNEDPYDEDPIAILKEMEAGFERDNHEIILDRRDAIRVAYRKAIALKQKSPVSVLITGKGTDPYIMGPNGTKIPWDDRDVAREEARVLVAQRSGPS